MTKISIDARSARSRLRLQDALLTLLIDHRLDDISVADIAATAGVGYATFFRHYSDKRALWNTVAGTLITEINTRLRPQMDAVERRRACLEICDFVAARRDQYRVLFAGGAADHVRKAMIEDALTLGIGTHDGGDLGLPPTLATYFGVNASFTIFAWWLNGRDEIDAATIAQAMERLVWSPIFDSGPARAGGARTITRR